MATILSICTQKGGAGKTTLTMHLATHFHAAEGVPVTVVDADYPQHSFFHQRQRDLARLREEPALREQVQRQGRLPYPVRKVAAQEVPVLLEELSARPGEVVFVDMPGSLNVPGYARIAAFFDGVILPLEADRLSFASGLMTLEAIARLPRRPGRSVRCRVLWNRYKLSERPAKYQSLEEAAERWCQSAGLAVPFMEARVRDLVGWKDHRSSLLPYPEIRPLAAEVRRVFLSES